MSTKQWIGNTMFIVPEEVADYIEELENKLTTWQALKEPFKRVCKERDEIKEQNKAIVEANALSLQEKRDKIKELEEIETDLNGSIGYFQMGVDTWKTRAEELEAELAAYQWINVEDDTPKYIKDMQRSLDIFIIDKGRVHIGTYAKGKYEWWSGAFCNTDETGSQKNITHWLSIITLPEPKENSNG